MARVVVNAGHDMGREARPGRELRDWESVVEKRIQEAQRRGEFERLSGEGKPLALGRNPYEDPAMEMAFKMLRDAGYAPEWIEADKDVRNAIARWRSSLREAWEAHAALERAIRAGHVPYTETHAAELLWKADQRQLRAELDSVNRMIDILNLKVPATRAQRLPLDFEAEMRRLARADVPNGPTGSRDERARRESERIHKAVLARETVPKPPRWARAFKRILLGGGKGSTENNVRSVAASETDGDVKLDEEQTGREH